jgi:hypothetical protein
MIESRGYTSLPYPSEVLRHKNDSLTKTVLNEVSKGGPLTMMKYGVVSCIKDLPHKPTN